jgi:predicted RNA-binding protein YlxR (DUF448 family)
VGCRRTAPKPDLVRFVADAGVLAPDPAAVRPGRGAYLHPTRACLARALRKRGFQRTLRQSLTIPEPLDLDLE